MPFIDATGVERGATVEAEVCVVGAGPAGLAIAIDLARAGLSVCLLESGGFSAEDGADGLDDVENVGLQLHAVGPLRNRQFGGTAWYGRSVVLDPIDFETRAWVPGSGWPVAPGEVTTRYERAARFLGVDRPAALDAGFWRDEPAHRALGGGGIVPRAHLISRVTHLGRHHRRAVLALPRLTVVLHATVTGIEMAEASRSVARLRVRGPGGQELWSRARRYVLACGGLANAHLLLRLSADSPPALGPSAVVLGRFYMNHARCEGAARLYLDPEHPEHLALFRGLTEGYSARSRSRVQLAAGLDEEVQRREGLLNACAFFHGQGGPRVARVLRLVEDLRRGAAARTLARTDLARLRELGASLPLALRAGIARLRRRPSFVEHLVMVEQLEQAPDPESRLTLSEQRDRFGLARLRLDWRIGPDSLRTQRRLHELLSARVRQLRIGRLESALLSDPRSEPRYGDSAHPTGSTRMSHDPRHGVVNSDCRVHAVENLYVAGSSVFPTAGHANPTLALVALALRLADHLREETSAAPCCRTS